MNSHKLYEGEIFHKRFHPKTNKFKYKFYFLDINVHKLSSLKNRYFSQNRFNLFSFNTKDHFGKSDDFTKNAYELIEKFGLEKPDELRFVTLPRVLNFVFNPISVLILINNYKITNILAEVHNYNGGRVIYPIKLEENNNKYKGRVKKDMYVSPYFKTEGVYEFELKYNQHNFDIKIDLYEDDIYKLTAQMRLQSMDFNQSNSLKIFFKYLPTNFLVVTRTYFQAIKLFIKGLKIYSPRDIDKVRRY
jgi:DUF1365 family protein